MLRPPPLDTYCAPSVKNSCTFGGAGSFAPSCARALHGPPAGEAACDPDLSNTSLHLTRSVTSFLQSSLDDSANDSDANAPCPSVCAAAGALAFAHLLPPRFGVRAEPNAPPELYEGAREPVGAADSLSLDPDVQRPVLHSRTPSVDQIRCVSGSPPVAHPAQLPPCLSSVARALAESDDAPEHWPPRRLHSIEERPCDNAAPRCSSEVAFLPHSASAFLEYVDLSNKSFKRRFVEGSASAAARAESQLLELLDLGSQLAPELDASQRSGAANPQGKLNRARSCGCVRCAEAARAHAVSSAWGAPLRPDEELSRP